MTIAFNGTTLSGQRSGVGFYTYNLLKALWSIDTENNYLGWISEDCPEEALFQTPNVRIFATAASIRQPYKHTVWEHLILPRELKKHEVDVFFSPSHTLPYFYPKNMGKVVTVHDLAFFHYPETKSRQFRAYMSWMIRHMVRHTNQIIVDSEQTRQDMIHMLNVPSSRLKRVYLAASEHFNKPVSDTDLKRVRKKYNLAKPVVLAVGDIESRKNLSRLIEAFALIRQKADLQLVLVGRPKRGLEVLQHLIESHQLTDHVVQTGYVVDEDMPVLYHLSKVFVYPSLYEGFGIPPLEAMMCGTPVVASKASSIPEVIGDAGVLVDPESVEDIADSIERVLWDPVFAQTLVEKGYQRAQQFSWEITAKETLQIFETAKK